MIETKVWLITGAGRGLGAALSEAALAAGNAVVATGRRPDEVAKVLGASDGLLVVRLDVTSVADANGAVDAALERFGRIDVLVNTPERRSRATSRRCRPNTSSSSWPRICWVR